MGNVYTCVMMWCYFHGVCILLLVLTGGELYIEALVLALDPPLTDVDPPHLLEPTLLVSALLAVDLLLALELLGSSVIDNQQLL